MTVYSSLRCRQIFCKPENAALRKQKSIKAVIRRHRLTVSVFSEDQLVQILQHLLKEGIFESKHEARSVFPELFPPPIVQEAVETVTGSSMPDRTDSIMEEQRTWLRKQVNSDNAHWWELTSDALLGCSIPAFIPISSSYRPISYMNYTAQWCAPGLL